jgi:hypothetical protein
MTLQQQTAIASPCVVAEQCANRAFFRALDFRGRRFRVGLTVNVGSE